jgi:hypothetical protein
MCRHQPRIASAGPAEGSGTRAGRDRDHRRYAPARIVERNVSAKGRRVGLGTYELADTPDGGTRVAFTYSWDQAPLLDRALAPLVRAVLRRGNQRALERLAEQLA